MCELSDDLEREQARTTGEEEVVRPNASHPLP
jgi:hypothetical protein